MELAIKYWKRTGILTPKCPKCGWGNMELIDCCYNSDPPHEHYVCKVCQHEEEYRGIYSLQAGLIEALKGEDLSKVKLSGVRDMKRSEKEIVAVYGENGPDVRIRKVKILQGRLREMADKQGLKPEDLVLVKTTIKPHQLPIYEIEKVEGDPVSFMLKRAGRGARLR